MERFSRSFPGERSLLKQGYPQPFLRAGDYRRASRRAGAYDNPVKVIHRDAATAPRSGV